MSYAIRIGDRLLKQGILGPDALEEALVRQAKTRGRIGTILFDMGVVSRYTLTNLLNRHHGLPMLVVADDIHVKQNAVAAFPRNFAMQHKAMPISNPAPYFVVGFIDPPSSLVVREIESLVRKPVRVTILPEAIFHQVRRDYLKIDTDFFAQHVDPAKIVERPFQEGHQQREPRDLIVFEAGGVSLAFVRRRKDSAARRIGDMLIEDGLVSQGEIDGALARHPGMHVGEALMDDNVLDARTLSRYLSRHYQCATVDPYSPLTIAPDILKLIHPGTARKFQMIPLAIYEGNLLVLTSDPENPTALMVAKNESGHEVRPVVTPRACARWHIDNLYKLKAAKT